MSRYSSDDDSDDDVVKLTASSWLVKSTRRWRHLAAASLLRSRRIRRRSSSSALNCITATLTNQQHIRHERERQIHVHFNPLTGTGNYSATSNNMELHWPLMGGLLHLVQRGQDWVGPQPTQAPPRCTKCNSPPINSQCTYHHIGPLLCDFNVPITGSIYIITGTTLDFSCCTSGSTAQQLPLSKMTAAYWQNVQFLLHPSGHQTNKLGVSGNWILNHWLKIPTPPTVLSIGKISPAVTHTGTTAISQMSTSCHVLADFVYVVIIYGARTHCVP